MEIRARLADLPTMHPRLLWESVAASAAALLTEQWEPASVPLSVECRDIPGMGSEVIQFDLDCRGLPENHIDQLRRTYETSRLVEFAAIAITGLALYHAGGHEIVDVALRGTAADYLVDSTGHPLEIAGRSRRGDLETAWRHRHMRLADRRAGAFYVSVVEFETPSGRLEFFESPEK